MVGGLISTKGTGDRFAQHDYDIGGLNRQPISVWQHVRCDPRPRTTPISSSIKLPTGAIWRPETFTLSGNAARSIARRIKRPAPSRYRITSRAAPERGTIAKVEVSIAGIKTGSGFSNITSPAEARSTRHLRPGPRWPGAGGATANHLPKATALFTVEHATRPPSPRTYTFNQTGGTFSKRGVSLSNLAVSPSSERKRNTWKLSGARHCVK